MGKDTETNVRGVTTSEGYPHSDRDIAAAVRDELVNEHAVDASQVKVSSISGVVTLKGTVDSIMAKERAVQRAQLVKGVRAVSDRMQVKVTGKPDQEISANIRGALLRDPATESYEVEVEVDSGNVRLSGEVDSYAEKRLAERVAKSVTGVRSLDNQITVEFAAVRSDFDMEKDIEKRLKWDALVTPGVYVDVLDGRAVLYGTVSSLAEKQRAALDARVLGVHDVDDSGIVISPWTRDKDVRKTKHPMVPDDLLEAAVRDAMYYDPRVNAFDLTVDSDAGVVTLKGEVSTLRAMLAAVDLAQNTVGTVSVNNEIEVALAEPPSDATIAQELRTSLILNPFTEAYEITVKVDAGVATLEGEVDTLGEKAEAEDIANSIEGVTAVANNLEVEQPDTRVTYEAYIYPYYPYVTSWSHYAPATAVKSDEVIEEEIADEMFWSPFVDPDQITVEVNNGKAVLTGTVDSFRAMAAAETNALEGGAVAVENRLKVEFDMDIDKGG